MTKLLKMVRVNVVLFSLFACAPVTSVTQKIAPTVQPTSVKEVHPLTTRTGIDQVDTVLEAVASSDAQRLRSLIQFTNTQCTRRDGLGGPPKCRAGEAEGTSVEVLPFLGPEGYFFHKDEIEKWQGVEATGLYAIYEVSPKVIPEENYPAGKYVIMLLGKGNDPAISLRIQDGRIVQVDYNFENSSNALNEWIQREAAKVILASVTR